MVCTYKLIPTDPTYGLWPISFRFHFLFLSQKLVNFQFDEASSPVDCSVVWWPHIDSLLLIHNHTVNIFSSRHQTFLKEHNSHTDTTQLNRTKSRKHQKHYRFTNCFSKSNMASSAISATPTSSFIANQV